MASVGPVVSEIMFEHADGQQNVRDLEVQERS